MMGTYTFSLAEENDSEAVVALYTACSKLPGCTWSEDYPTREEFDIDLSRGWLYCLKEDSEIIAVVSLGDFQELQCVGITWSKYIRRPCELARIGVKPEHGGKGVGTYLLNQSIGIARNLNFDGIRLLVSPQNQPAVAMYRRAGFKTVGEIDKYDRHWLCQELAL
jgi:ribosomal protein S18 acetylase RimI-like enzyme